MKTEAEGRGQILEKGQLWKLEHGYVHIVDFREQLVQYRVLKQVDQRTAITKRIGVEALLNYLQQSEAQLIPSPV